jgi:hypothetical protein
MLRRAASIVLLFVSLSSLAQHAQSSSQSALQNYFVGRQVRLQIDMPGTQQGVDLRMDRDDPMDWKSYSNRLKQFGPAIRTGDRSTITTIVVKKNLIEFQLDGGGFGTFWDDSSTTVTPYHVDKSNYEKQLERDLRNETDPQRRRDLQRELDRARSRRDRDQAADDRAAMIASQLKAQQVEEKRMRGGSRFNLRWAGTIPPDQLTPEAIMKLLDGYVDFGDLQAQKPILSATAQHTSSPPASAPQGAPSSPSRSSNVECRLARLANSLG